jgi:DNA-binding NtrC family response regulator
MNSAKKRRLLVVDDATYLLSCIRRILADRADAWDMVFIEDPVVALAEASKEPFDVVVSDYHMPGMHGVDLVTKIKTVTPETVCIIMTGSEDDAELLMEIDAVSDVLLKPCETSRLLSAINNAVGG